jgi:hypothetical protein
MMRRAKAWDRKNGALVLLKHTIMVVYSGNIAWNGYDLYTRLFEFLIRPL